MCFISTEPIQFIMSGEEREIGFESVEIKK
jgi:hypothetical protein